MTRNIESRLAKLEERSPKGRHFYVWKDSEAQRQAEATCQSGDVIHVISWLDGPAADSANVGSASQAR